MGEPQVKIENEVLLAAGIDLSRPLQLGPGRKASKLQVAYSRDLTVEDLISTQEHAGITAISIKEIRTSHHQLARVLAQAQASGQAETEVSIITGYSPGRISVLKGDPQFKELLQYYSDMEAQQYSVARADMHTRLASLGFDAIETLHDKLRDEPDSFDSNTLLKIVEATADRTGHGKTSTVSHDHTHSLSQESLAKLKAVTESGRPLAEADRGALLRLAADRTAVEHSDAEEADWEPSSGGGLREEGGAGSEEEVSAG